jgi:tetratricopeptide (TPR) repeat protein
MRGERDGAGMSARGGPGTFRGTHYQLRFAVLRTLELLEHQLLAPHRPLTIALESLTLESGQTEKWDVGCEPPLVVTEAKLKPAAADIRAFLTAARTSRATRIELVFAERSGRLHAALEQLETLQAAAADADRFARFVAEKGGKVAELAQLLGPAAFEVLDRIRLINLPDGVLNDELVRRSRALVGDPDERLIDLLVRRFSAGAGQRRRFALGDLLAELAERGFELQLPPGSSVELDGRARAALVVLQRAQAAVPLDVLTQAARATPAGLAELLAPLRADGLLSEDDGLWTLGTLPAPVHAPEESRVLADALEALLAWIDDRHGRASAARGVDAALALSRACAEQHPEAVAPVFRVLDKLLKRRGDKRLVMEVATRSIDASGRVANRSDAMVQAEAIALICGRSWVYQRIGELWKARADGEHSLQLGEQIGWELNSAFAHKCLGRICRMEAEACEEPERSERLADSVRHLKEAIVRFSALRRDVEVGDAWSLLARSRLVGRDLDGARAAVAEAEQRLVDPAEKDYVDLLIVRGDIAAANGERRVAEEDFGRAIELTRERAEHSEMLARALHRRGRLRIDGGRVAAARDDLGQAVAIYRALGDPHLAAASELELMRLDRRLPTRGTEPHPARVLELEPPLVQVHAVYAHEEAVRSRTRGEAALAFRSDATVEHWRQMVELGRRAAAQEDRPW